MPEKQAIVEKHRDPKHDPNLDLLSASPWVFADQTFEDKAAAINATVRHYKGLEPQDAIETGLARLMTEALNMGLGHSGMAKRTMGDPETSTRYTAYSLKAIGVYAQLTELFDRRRGKADQNVVVKYVSVQPGAQAIVGNVTTNGPALPAASDPMLAAPAAQRLAAPAINDVSSEIDPKKASIEHRARDHETRPSDRQAKRHRKRVGE